MTRVLWKDFEGREGGGGNELNKRNWGVQNYFTEFYSETNKNREWVKMVAFHITSVIDNNDILRNDKLWYVTKWQILIYYENAAKNHEI